MLDTFTRSHIDLVNDTFFCAGSEIQLSANNTFTAYNWSTGENTKTITVNKSGSYRLSVIDSNGCEAKSDIKVNVKALPVPLSKFDYKVCEPSFDIVAKSGMKYYIWSDGTTGPVLHITDYGKYNLLVTDSFGCIASTDINVRNNCEANIYVPNAFTPNGDGINDYFSPVVRNVTSLYWFVIDRWGKVVFESYSTDNKWDGKADGIPQATDAYVYVVKCIGNDGNEKTLSGNVTLLR